MQRQNANPQQLPNGFSYQSRALSAQKSLDLFYYLQHHLVIFWVQYLIGFVDIIPYISLEKNGFLFLKKKWIKLLFILKNMENGLFYLVGCHLWVTQLRLLQVRLNTHFYHF